jgi:hypothetical protein
MAMKVNNNPGYSKLPSIDLGFEGRPKVNSLDNVQYRPGGGNELTFGRPSKPRSIEGNFEYPWLLLTFMAIMF